MQVVRDNVKNMEKQMIYKINTLF